jgi:hypothetical protein
VGNVRRKPEVYEFIVQDHIDPHWADWFEGLTLCHLACGQTRLIGPVADQAALHGILNRIRDLGIPLLLVRRRAAQGDDLLAGEDVPTFGVHVRGRIRLVKGDEDRCEKDR